MEYVKVLAVSDEFAGDNGYRIGGGKGTRSDTGPSFVLF
jgi:hypothetical protein